MREDLDEPPRACYPLLHQSHHHARYGRAHWAQRQWTIVFYSVAGDCPEHIVCSTVDLAPDWRDWIASPPVSVIAPERDYEGADLPLEPSQRGAIHARARQLRDPGVYEEDGRIYLLYSVVGEKGIAIAELETRRDRLER